MLPMVSAPIGMTSKAHKSTAQGKVRQRFRPPSRAVSNCSTQVTTASPALPIGPALAQHGINLMAFCKEYNARTASMAGQIVPAELTIYADSSFTFVLRTPPTADLLRRAAGVEKGSAVPNKQKVASITRKQLRDIAEPAMHQLQGEDPASARLLAGLMGWSSQEDAAELAGLRQQVLEGLRLANLLPQRV